jgi:hypothetical protein
VEIIIKDDEGWEPDRDFFVKLYKANGAEMIGKDTTTKITVIDDD